MSKLVFNSKNFHLPTLLISLLMLCLGLSASNSVASETVTLNLIDGPMRCEVLKMTKSLISLKGSGGKQMDLSLGMLTPKEVFECTKLIDAKTKDATFCFDIGSYLVNKKYWDGGKELLNLAVKHDEKLAVNAEPFFKKIEEGLQPKQPTPAVPPIKPTPPTPEVKPAETKPVEEKKPEKNPNEIEIKPGESIQDAIKRSQADFADNFKKQVVAPLGEKEMKEFLDKRLEELNKKIGGKWRLIETKHFYCFSNLPEPKHKTLSVDWLETLQDPDGVPGIYPLLCSVLRHKEGDKLWNNKCPIYFFDRYGEFQNFAGAIDGSPGAGNSGGYFSARGREVHICIPFMTQRMGEKAADRQARNTLYHEGTHAFLQLTGEDVPITRWMHEGLAQFIEFWFDPKNNSDRQRACMLLNRDIKEGGIPSWNEMKERPQGGMDSQGYAWAWIKMEFLYRNADNQRLPTMIRSVKAGKTEDDAFLETFKLPVDKIETLFQVWLKDVSKKGFNF